MINSEMRCSFPFFLCCLLRTRCRSTISKNTNMNKDQERSKNRYTMAYDPLRVQFVDLSSFPSSAVVFSATFR